MSYVNRAGYEITMPPLAPMSLIGGGGDVQIEAEATAETLDPNEPASASVTSETAGGVTTLEFSFGIPKGEKGDKGDKGDNGENGQDGAPGQAGAPGQDGVSPVVTASQNPTTGVITINVVDGTGSHDYNIPSPAPIKIGDGFTDAEASAEATVGTEIDIVTLLDSQYLPIRRYVKYTYPDYYSGNPVSTDVGAALYPEKPGSYKVQSDHSTTLTLGGLSSNISSLDHLVSLNTFMNQIHRGVDNYYVGVDFNDKLRAGGGLLLLHCVPYVDGTNPTTIKLTACLKSSTGANTEATYDTHYFPRGAISAPYAMHYMHRNLVDVGGTTYPVPIQPFTIPIPIYPLHNPSQAYLCIREELVQTYSGMTPSLPIELFGVIVPLG